MRFVCSAVQFDSWLLFLFLLYLLCCLERIIVRIRCAWNIMSACLSVWLAVSPEVHVCSAAHLNFAFDCIICYCFGELWESIERTFQKMKSNDRIAQATSGLLIVPTKTIACIL